MEEKREKTGKGRGRERGNFVWANMVGIVLMGNKAILAIEKFREHTSVARKSLSESEYDCLHQCRL